MPKELMIGMDVGSTTVKAVVVDPSNLEILWSDYQRHETRQPEKVMEFLVRIGNEFQDVPQENIRMFVTGSGATTLTGPRRSRLTRANLRLSTTSSSPTQDIHCLPLEIRPPSPKRNGRIILGKAPPCLARMIPNRARTTRARKDSARRASASQSFARSDRKSAPGVLVSVSTSSPRLP